MPKCIIVGSSLLACSEVYQSGDLALQAAASLVIRRLECGRSLRDRIGLKAVEQYASKSYADVVTCHNQAVGPAERLYVVYLDESSPQLDCVSPAQLEALRARCFTEQPSKPVKE